MAVIMNCSEAQQALSIVSCHAQRCSAQAAVACLHSLTTYSRGKCDQKCSRSLRHGVVVHAVHFAQSGPDDSSLLVCILSIGGDLAPPIQEADEQIGKKGKLKVSRKERLQKKRDQKRAERQAGSDDEDVNQGECEPRAGAYHCSL